MKHSPFPWKFRGRTLYDANGYAILRDFGAGNDVTISQDISNRELIEAAPESCALVRVLASRLETVLRMHGGTEAQIQTHPELCAARALLRKLEAAS